MASQSIYTILESIGQETTEDLPTWKSLMYVSKEKKCELNLFENMTDNQRRHLEENVDIESAKIVLSYFVMMLSVEPCQMPKTVELFRKIFRKDNPAADILSEIKEAKNAYIDAITKKYQMSFFECISTGIVDVNEMFYEIVSSWA